MEHPFLPGARVFIVDRYDDVREAFIDKVYKTGRFTLMGSTQQWKAYQWADSGTWRAHATGRGYSWNQGTLQLWDDSADALLAQHKLKQRWTELVRKLHNVSARRATVPACLYLEHALGLLSDD